MPATRRRGAAARRVFFSLHQPPQCPRVKVDGESLGDRLGQFAIAKFGSFSTLAADERSHFRGDLARALGTRPPWQQTVQPSPLKGRVGEIESLSAEAEASCSFGHRQPVHMMAAQHLVLDLDQVVGIEERRVLAEKRILHPFGAGVVQAAGFGPLLVTVPLRHAPRIQGMSGNVNQYESRLPPRNAANHPSTISAPGNTRMP